MVISQGIWDGFPDAQTSLEADFPAIPGSIGAAAAFFYARISRITAARLARSAASSASVIFARLA
jgi:hypothetical protein